MYVYMYISLSLYIYTYTHSNTTNKHIHVYNYFSRSASSRRHQTPAEGGHQRQSEPLARTLRRVRTFASRTKIL